MVAQLFRLRLALLTNTFRRRPLQLTGMIVALLYALGLAGLVVVGFTDLRATTPDIARAVLTSFGSLVIVAFAVLPLVFGSDDPLDPRRFSLFGIPATPLSVAIAVAGLASIPSLIVAIFALAQIGVWAREPVSLLFAVVGAACIIATCVLAARISSVVASSWLSSHRARDSTGTALVTVLVIAAPVLGLLAVVDWQAYVLPVVRRIAAVASWTPFGSAWSAPGDAALGDTGTAALKILISLAFVAILALVWRTLVGFVLVRPQRDAVARTYSGLGWFERLPATPLGAIAARSLSYWGRDPRYGVSLVVIPIIPIIMVIALLVAGVPGEIVAWVPVPVMCLFLGWTVHNDIASDSSAFWAHVSASTRGSDDRWGRLVPALVIGIPLAVIGSLVTVWVIGDGTMLPGLVGLSLCVLFVALGVSSVISAAFPYPAVRPGDSPFAQPQAVGASSAVIQSLSFVTTLVLTAPVVAFIVLFPDLPEMQLISLGGGVLLGLLVLVGGVYGGGRVVNRRAPELLAFTLQN